MLGEIEAAASTVRLTAHAVSPSISENELISVAIEAKANTLRRQGTSTDTVDSVIPPVQSVPLNCRSDPVPAPLFGAETVIRERLVYAEPSSSLSSR